MDIRIADHALALIRELNRAGYEAYAVGGCVRDLLRGVEPHDYDLCTAATPEDMRRVFAHRKIVETGAAHGTLSVESGGEFVEITTFRSEGKYSDGRRPDSVSFGTSLLEDLRRRDFTVNAMALGVAESARAALPDAAAAGGSVADRSCRNPVVRGGEAEVEPRGVDTQSVGGAGQGEVARCATGAAPCRCGGAGCDAETLDGVGAGDGCGGAVPTHSAAAADSSAARAVRLALPTLTLIDPFGGADDLAAGLLRCVGKPRERFDEDALRILRALRFASTLGFDIEENTAKALENCRKNLKNVSSERIFAELCAFLLGEHAGELLERFPSVFAEFLPEISTCVGFEHRSPWHCFDVWTHICRALACAVRQPLCADAYEDGQGGGAPASACDGGATRGTLRATAPCAIAPAAPAAAAATGGDASTPNDVPATEHPTGAAQPCGPGVSAAADAHAARLAARPAPATAPLARVPAAAPARADPSVPAPAPTAAPTAASLRCAADPLAVRLALLLHDIAKPAVAEEKPDGRRRFHGHQQASAKVAEIRLKELKSPRKLRELVVKLVELHDDPPLDRAALARSLRTLGEGGTRALLAVSYADALAHDLKNPRVFETRIGPLRAAWRELDELLASGAPYEPSRLAVNGRDLAALGLTGRSIADTLERLCDLAVAGSVANDRAALLSAAQNFDKIQEVRS